MSTDRMGCPQDGCLGRSASQCGRSSQVFGVVLGAIVLPMRSSVLSSRRIPSSDWDDNLRSRSSLAERMGIKGLASAGSNFPMEQCSGAVLRHRPCWRIDDTGNFAAGPRC